MGDYRIIIADDNAMLRQGLKKIIEEESDIKVVGEACDGLELESILNAAVPDMVILDISMPNMRGLETIGIIKEKYHALRVLIISMHKDIEYVSGALSAGAAGYLLKEDAGLQLSSAIEKVRDDGIYLSRGLSECMAEDWVKILRGQGGHSGKSAPLTKRERQIVKLIAAGKSYKEISNVLNISSHTVDRHRANIMDKLPVKNVADLIRYVFLEGYI